MSDLDRRLTAISPGLSARERVILILRADAGGQREDPAWRRMPDYQGPAFNHFVGLANGVNHIVVPHATVLLSEVETTEARFGWLTAFVAWGTERALRLELDGDAEPHERALSPPWTVIPVFGVEAPLRDDSALSDADRGLRALARRLAREIPERWARLLALEQVVEEIVREFQDDVVIPDVLRDFLVLTRAKLERLYEQAPQLVGNLERPEADDPRQARPRDRGAARSRVIASLDRFDRASLAQRWAQARRVPSERCPRAVIEPSATNREEVAVVVIAPSGASVAA